VSKGYIE